VQCRNRLASLAAHCGLCVTAIAQFLPRLGQMREIDGGLSVAAGRSLPWMLDRKMSREPGFG
jgi:hypothetical protein